MRSLRPFALMCFGIMLAALLTLPGLSTVAQESTPVPIRLPSTTPLPTAVPVAGPTGTRAIPILEISPTPAPLSGVAIRVRYPPGNVRQAPDYAAEKIGEIKENEFYPVVSRSFKWLQIAFNKNGYEFGWVYEDIVIVQGNLNSVPVNGAAPTANVPTVQAGQTTTAQANSVIRTPGGFASATSARAQATGVFLRTPTLEPTLGGPKPTFTYAPQFAEATLAPRNAGFIQTGMPPIVPIIGLAALGLFGLLISSLRRL